MNTRSYGPDDALPEYRLDEPEGEWFEDPDEDWRSAERRAEHAEHMRELLHDMALDAQERGVGSTRHPLDLDPDDECPF